MFRNSPTHINISFSRGWLVTFSAGFMGFCIGVLYVWSVIKAGIPDSWGWSNSDKALPYSVMCVMFAAVMMPAGRFQDRYCPRWAIVIGGFLTGLGCIIAGLGGKSTLAYVIGYGIITPANGWPCSITSGRFCWRDPKQAVLSIMDSPATCF